MSIPLEPHVTVGSIPSPLPSAPEPPAPANSVEHAAAASSFEPSAPATPSDQSDLLFYVRQRTLEAVQEGAPSISHVAKLMAVSTRTLQRRLAEQGQTFQDVLDEVRDQLARKYMAQPGRTLKEIASLLAYSNRRAFARAFKRWEGLAPRALRQELLASAPPRPSAPGPSAPRPSAPRASAPTA